MAKLREDLFVCEGCCEFKEPTEMHNGSVTCRSCYVALVEALAVLERAGCVWVTVAAKDRLLRATPS